MNMSLQELDKPQEIPTDVKPAETKPADTPAEEKPKEEEKPSEEELDGEKPSEDALPEDKPEEGDEAELFWQDVDKIRGEKIEIEYGEVDPLSPQGVYMREKEIERRAVLRFEEHIRTEDPRAYEYFLHRKAGKPDSEFFGRANVVLPDPNTLVNDVDLQSRVYKESLIEKGISEKQANALVDLAIKGGEIKELAVKAYEDREKQERKNLENLEKELKAKQDAYANAVQTIDKELVDTVNTGKNLQLLIQDAKKGEFLNFIRDHARYDEEGNEFYVALPLKPKESGQLIDALYFFFNKGDLKGLIKRAAETENTRRLRRTVDESKKRTQELPKDHKVRLIDL